MKDDESEKSPASLPGSFISQVINFCIIHSLKLQTSRCGGRQKNTGRFLKIAYKLFIFKGVREGFAVPLKFNQPHF
jgi:hypothetical protein